MEARHLILSEDECKGLARAGELLDSVLYLLRAFGVPLDPEAKAASNLLHGFDFRLRGSAPIALDRHRESFAS